MLSSRCALIITNSDTVCKRLGTSYEALMQVVYSNAFNTNRSPAVVVTNLVKTHYVLCLVRGKGGGRPHFYQFRKAIFPSFADAVAFALVRGQEPCILRDGRVDHHQRAIRAQIFACAVFTISMNTVFQTVNIISQENTRSTNHGSGS